VESYSQLGQDVFVLQVLGFPHGGYFLDSGASNGIDASNTYLLEQRFGWRGICVEPNDAFFSALVKRRRAHCVHCCLYDRDDVVEFVEAGTLGGVLADYHPRLLAAASRACALPVGPDGVPPTAAKPARTIASLLEAFGAPRVLDYWSLDTEGSELRILRSFPFHTHRVRVLTVEHNRYPVRDEIRRFLTGQGYVFAHDFGIDDAYVEPSLVGARASCRRWFRRRGRARRARSGSCRRGARGSRRDAADRAQYQRLG
jgi:hypothetical protein